ncbi:hypothetical protein M0802_003160 [Mischocyttarus mexicanus]|nr:hypothetical protein M0802_003160 [Mischocyttarus mexicanus]
MNFLTYDLFVQIAFINVFLLHRTVLLNNKPLSLFKETELPVLEPVIYYNENGLSIELSSGGIGFWVVPDQKIRSCMDHKVEKENVIEKILRKELQESQIKGNEKGRKVEDMNILTIDHSKPENTWINVEDDYRGYTPNEFFETTSITNVGMKENSNDYYTNIWQGENILKHWVNQENDKEENAKTKPVANVASDVGEERRIKGNTVNMLMNYYSDSSASKSNQENLEESFRVKTQGSKLEDTSVVSLGKTKLTLPDRRRTMTIPIEEDKMTDLGVLHYSKSIGVPMNVLTYTDSKQSQRTKRKVKDLDMILEKEMIDEDEANSKDCKCRVIRNFNDDSKFITFKVKRRVNKNYKDSTKSDKENVDNYETEHYEETTESGNENVENYETEHYEETTESGNENVDNYETEHYEETTESGNENIDNYETEHYEETTESGNENIENYETEHYEETTESSNEKLENYETEQLEKIDKQLVELIKSEFDEIDDYEVDDTSTMITELSNQLSENLENNLNVYDDELKTNEEKFFRGPSGQTKKTEEEINYNKDLDGVNSTLSQNIASISEKETKTTEVRIISDTSSSKESKDTEITENEDPTTVIFEREKSLKRIKKQVRNVLSRRKKSENESSKISQMLLTKSMDHSKPKMNFDLKKAEAIEEALLTSSNENLTVVKIENENRKSRATKLKEKRNQHNHRERRELSEMIGSKLRVKEEKISEQYKDKISDTIKGNNVNENKMKREIWEITKNNEDDEYTINLKKYPYVLTYEPINDDMLEKRRQKNQEEKKLNPLAVIISPLKNIREKLIEPKSYLHDKLDGSKSGLIQSLRFPYNISDERKRYDKDQVAFDKGYYPLVDSIQEKNPWMFQYQRKSNEKLRNAYQSKGKEILSENSKIPILKIPIGYMHNESEETMKSKERSNTRQPDYKIYSIDPSTYKSVVDPELEIHEYSSSESLIYDDDDSTPDFYNLILKPKFDKIILKRLKSNQDRKNSPIIYVSNIKRQKNVQKQTEESKIVNNSTNFKEDDSKSMEEDLTNEDYSIAIIPSSIENVEKIEGISNIGENHENIKNRRTRRDVEKNERTRLKRHNYANFNDDLMLNQFYKNSEIFSKLLRKSNLVESKSENSNENSRLPMDASFEKNYRIDEDLSKNTVTLPKDIDLIEKLDQILLDDNKFLHFKPEENESSNSEDDEDDSSEKYLNKLDYVRSLRYTNNMLQRENEIFKNPKSNLKHVYNYIKENDNDKSWKDINHENLNKKSEILGHFSKFNRLSIPTGENNEDNILKDFSQHDSVMKNNGQRDQPNGSNKSSFLQGAIPKLQEMITEGFDKTQNLTEPLEEFTESIDKKFNGTLPKDDKNNIFQSGTSSMNTENIFQTLIMNVKKFFAFLFDFNRIKFD